MTKRLHTILNEKWRPDTLEGYFVKHQYKGNFVISPSKGEIYMITTEEVVAPPPKKFNIYGDY
jgi:hypothetical protein